MIYFDDVYRRKQKRYYPNWLEIPDYPYKILIVGVSGSRILNVLHGLINYQHGIDKMYLYSKNQMK